MSLDLFDTEAQLITIPLPGGDLQYAESVPLLGDPEALLRRLIIEIPWRQETITVWGKSHLQPRLVAWFGDSRAPYTYSGISLSALPWTPILSGIKESVERLANNRFNSVLLNYYRDHRDSMGYHSDDEPELGERPVIASLSLGAERPFVLKPKDGRISRPVKITLKSGSLLIMKGSTQKNWKHGIGKESRPCGPRVNLTFRQIMEARS